MIAEIDSSLRALSILDLPFGLVQELLPISSLKPTFESIDLF